MKALKPLPLLLFLTLSFHMLHAQDLEDILEEETSQVESAEVHSVFKTTRVINGQSTKNLSKQELLFVISHRFDRLNKGAYEFFGLDGAMIRLGLDYGITDRLMIGIGRSTISKTYDINTKIKILHQQNGGPFIPVSLSVFSSVAYETFPRNDYPFVSGLIYTHQALISNKTTDRLSLQLSPSFIHRNLVKNSSLSNDLYLLGIGGRYKITRRVSINMEYFHLLNQSGWKNSLLPLSLGFDIETGGHVFQLHLTNSRSITEHHFMSETTGEWLDGDIHFGFNIVRSFFL